MKINLLKGDCLKKMKIIPDKSIDMILVDPPYGTTACSWDYVIPFKAMWENINRVIKDNGAICIFGAEPFSSHLRLSNIKNFKYDWVWHKNSAANAVNGRNRPLKFYEFIHVFNCNGSFYRPIKEKRLDVTGRSTNYKVNYRNSKKENGKEKILGLNQTDPKILSKLRFPSAIQFFPSLHNNSKKGKVHPTQKPVELLKYLIKTYTLENETVLDFTMGSGSTGVACKELNRNFIGIEKDEKYFEIAKKRINEQ